MNIFDYFFNESKSLDKNFILNRNDIVSYADLYENSLIIASYIKKTIGEGNNIILISQNSSYFVTVYLGIIKSGNVCVPLNFSIEQYNLDYIVSLTKCDLIFASKQVLKKLNFDKVKKLHDEDGCIKIIEKGYQTNFIENFDEEKLAEIIFTSGSTGEPKGVMISHKNIMANTNSIIKYLNLTENDIISVVLPFYYCYGLSLLHTHLKVGGSIVLNNTFMFLGTVIKDLINYKCTGFAGVPSHFQMLLKKSDSFKKTQFPDLRYVTQAGGKLPNTFIEEFVETFPDKNFYVMYGQTEATARLSYLDPDKVKDKLGSIGKAIPNVALKIVDKNGSEVGIGVEGELIANGDNIMKGYFKDASLTNTMLRNNWLYTGDIAKKDKDGFIYIISRKKEIIKVGGKRVSPKEIEEVILKVDNVVDCTVKGVYDEILGEALKATVIINIIENEDELKNEILIKCKENLALYKIPHFFEFDNEMNVKSTGKKYL